MPCRQCENGKWRWGSGPCVYPSRAACERANAGQKDTPLAFVVRGISGSGKSHLARQILKTYSLAERDLADGIPCVRCHLSGRQPITVLGRYDIDLAGIDTIGLEPAIGAAKTLLGAGANTLFEGVLFGASEKLIELDHAFPDTLCVLGLRCDIPTAARRLRDRRTLVGDERLVRESDLESQMQGLETSFGNLETAGVDVAWYWAHEAEERIMGALGG